MARKRMIDPEIIDSAYAKGWKPDDFTVMISAILTADDEGRGRVSMIFRNISSMISEKKFKKCLQKLDDPIKIYQKIYFFLPNFKKYQTINRPRPSKFPDPKLFEITNLTPKISQQNHNTFTTNSHASEVKRREEKRSEVNIIHYDLSDFFSLFTLAFSEISSQEKNQISVIVKEYDPPISLAEQYGIFKSLIKRIQDGPEKKKTKAYLFGTYKIMLQDSCGALSREESQKLKKQMIHDFEK